MNKTPKSNSSSTAEAIDQALAAETSAREAMQASQQQAEQISAEAREHARRINRNANRRASDLRRRCNRLVKQRIDEMREAASKDPVRSELNDADRHSLNQAVQRLAGKLSQPEDSDG